MLFQSFGAIDEKARSPYRVRVRGPGARSRWMCEEDLSLRVQVDTLGEMRAVMYEGARPCFALKVRRRILNVIRCEIGSQCSDCSI